MGQCCCTQVVPEGNKPEWSGGQRGLHLYMQRLLQPTWDNKLMSAASKANPNTLMPNLSQEALQVTECYMPPPPPPPLSAALLPHSLTVSLLCVGYHLSWQYSVGIICNMVFREADALHAFHCMLCNSYQHPVAYIA